MTHDEIKVLKWKNRIALLTMRNKENARIVAKLVRQVRRLEAQF